MRNCCTFHVVSIATWGITCGADEIYASPSLRKIIKNFFLQGPLFLVIKFLLIVGIVHVEDGAWINADSMGPFQKYLKDKA